MQELLTYLENTDFVRWVYAPDEQNEAFWREFQKDNPKEVETIREARIILLRIKSKKEISDKRIESALPEILHKIQKKKQIQNIRRIAASTFRYAAIAILFFAIGLFIMQEKYRSVIDEMNRQFSAVSYYSGVESRLILVDGKNVIINEKLSNVRYRENGTIVIDEQDTIRQNIIGEDSMNQLIVPYGKNSSITLADGTVAFLNAGSRLIFPPVFEGKTRKVFLVGEGYFEVSHNPEIPFIVQTTDLDVNAVGTRFNVSAYPTESKIEIVLADGKVNINDTEFAFFHGTADMVPNDMISFDKSTKDIDRKKVVTENYTSWHLGYINFESVELQKIVTKLERYYDVNIYIEASGIAKKKITGKLKLKEDIDEVLRVLSVTSMLKTRKLNDHAYLLN